MNLPNLTLLQKKLKQKIQHWISFPNPSVDLLAGMKVVGGLVTAAKISAYPTTPTKTSSFSSSVTQTWVALWDSIWAKTAANELVILHVRGALLPLYMLLEPKLWLAVLLKKDIILFKTQITLKNVKGKNEAQENWHFFLLNFVFADW